LRAERKAERGTKREKRSVAWIRRVINYATYTRYELIPLYRSAILNREGLNHAGTVDNAMNRP